MLSVIIPVYNEEALLISSATKVHHYLQQQNIDHEIVVVSNGSTDQTVVLGEKYAAENSWFRFYSLSEKTVGGAFERAVREARNEFLVTLDIDLSSDLSFLDHAHDLLQYSDMVVGSKTMGEQRRSLLRVVGSNLYIIWAQLIFGLTISDYSMGCKGYRRSVIVPVLSELDRWTGYVFETVLYLKLQKRKILQIGVDCDDRRTSRFSLFHEGLYRYHHLWRCSRLMRDKGSWLYTAKHKISVEIASTK